MLPKNNRTEARATQRRCDSAQSTMGLYPRYKVPMMRSAMVMSWLIFLFKNKADIIGTYVRDKIKAPKIAKLTVWAMGRNIFPSMPPSAIIGKYTIKMIITPKAADLKMACAEIFTSSSMACWLITSPFR